MRAPNHAELRNAPPEEEIRDGGSSRQAPADCGRPHIPGSDGPGARCLRADAPHLGTVRPGPTDRADRPARVLPRRRPAPMAARPRGKDLYPLTETCPGATGHIYGTSTVTDENVAPVPGTGKPLVTPNFPGMPEELKKYPQWVLHESKTPP